MSLVFFVPGLIALVAGASLTALAPSIAAAIAPAAGLVRFNAVAR